jgi:hypothetical protein
MEVAGIKLEGGKRYDSDELWARLHRAAASPSASPLTKALFGSPVRPSLDRAYAGETPRIIATRKHVLRVLNREVERVQSDLELLQCRRAVRDIQEVLAGSAAAVAPGGEAGSPVTCAVLHGPLNPVEVSNCMMALEDALLTSV